MRTVRRIYSNGSVAYEYSYAASAPSPKKTTSRKKKVVRRSLFAFATVFSIIGLAFTGVFIAMQFHLLDVRGSSISRDTFYKALPKAPVYAAQISKTATATSCVELSSDGTQIPACSWNKSEEFSTIRDGIVKDGDVINKVASQTGVSSRMIAAAVIPEQLRWFTDDRESFKKVFEPLKVLGTAAHMTYGIGGFHEDTAKRVEQYTQDTNSPFYAGAGMDALVAYPGTENPSHTTTLARLSDNKDHYYSYLYVALFVKEVTNQWAKAGYAINNRPDVITTLYNIGFDRSVPKTNPQIGGATIKLNGTTYTYGELGVDFYNSDELTQIFPAQY
jgi:hypothetical protein